MTKLKINLKLRGHTASTENFLSKIVLKKSPISVDHHILPELLIIIMLYNT